MDLGIKGKKALVCASSKGLGLAVAERLAEEGCELFLCARHKEEIEAAAQGIRSKFGTNVEAVAVDLSTIDGPADLLDAAQKKLGAIDILVNNVGGPAPSAAATTSREAWQQGFQQLFLSATSLTQALVGGMMERGFGRIITITSLSVVEPIDHLAVSTSMRAAVTGFSKTLATEVAARGVTVNTVMPGVIHTQRIENLRKAKADRTGSTLAVEMEATANLIPAKRLGRPEELAALVAFLASPLASYINGTNIPVDGGLRKGWS